jgi:hypothetical protein
MKTHKKDRRGEEGKRGRGDYYFSLFLFCSSALLQSCDLKFAGIKRCEL